MATWQFDCFLVPSNSVEQVSRVSDIFNSSAVLWKGRDSATLFSALLRLGSPQKTWEECTVSWGPEDRTCIYLTSDETSGTIIELRIRVDLRSPSSQLLLDLLRTAKEQDLVVIGEDGDVIKPDFRGLLELASTSSAARFVADPVGFLKGVSVE